MGSRLEALIESVLMAALDSRYTQVGFNFISVQACGGITCKFFVSLPKVLPAKFIIHFAEDFALTTNSMVNKPWPGKGSFSICTKRFHTTCRWSYTILTISFSSFHSLFGIDVAIEEEENSFTAATQTVMTKVMPKLV